MTNQNIQTKKDLVVIDKPNAIEVFEKEKGLDPIIDEIRQRVKQQPYEISTKEGRTAMRSFAKFKIGSSKTTLVTISDSLTDGWRKKTKAVKDETKRMAEEVNKIRDGFVAPLIEFGTNEKERTDKYEDGIESIRQACIFEFEPTIEQIEQRLIDLEVHEPIDFEEFAVRKTGETVHSKETLNKKLTALKDQKAKEEELETLRKDKEKRQKLEHENKLKADAAEKARQEAEAKATREAAEAKAESERKVKESEEKAEADKKAAADKVDADKKAAQDKADADKKKIQDKKDEADRKTAQAEEDTKAADKRADEAAAAERKKIADQQKSDEDAAAKREADKKHNAKINNEAMEALHGNVNIDLETAKAIITAIAKGEIPHITINY